MTLQLRSSRTELKVFQFKFLKWNRFQQLRDNFKQFFEENLEQTDSLHRVNLRDKVQAQHKRLFWQSSDTLMMRLRHREHKQKATKA